MNDDREIKFGMSVANTVLSDIGDRLPKAKIFCDLVADLFSAENLDSVFDFYIASFSRRRDDPHQWKNYARAGEGFAIGLVSVRRHCESYESVTGRLNKCLIRLELV
jgi:hypothetical protein